jgi:hypothetical protein
MKYMTVRQCQAWVAFQRVTIGGDGLPERYPSLGPVLRFELPQAPHQLAWLCRFISRSLMPRHVSLLGIKEFGRFPSTENLHLYYRLRQSYSDHRLLDELLVTSFSNTKLRIWRRSSWSESSVGGRCTCFLNWRTANPIRPGR